MPFTDLDALIGDIRKEAARRRAAPDFPVDDEARLGVEMDRQGPSGGAVDVAAVLAAMQALADPGGSGGPGGLAELADLSASAVRALAARVADLDRRVDRLGPALDAPGTPVGGQSGEEPTGDGGPGRLDHWAPAVSAVAAGVGAGRILVAGPGAGRLVGRLAAEGADVYGVDPTSPAYRDEGMMRTGGVAAHLQTVGEAGLALAVLVGPLAAAELPHLGRWAAALGVRARTVLVLSEAPWAWRLRLGDAAADTTAWRPASPETWMAALHGAGYQLSGRYGPEGRDYCLAGSAAGPVEVPGP